MKIIDSMKIKIQKGKEKVETFYENHKDEIAFAATFVAIVAVTGWGSEKCKNRKLQSEDKNIITAQHNKITELQDEVSNQQVKICQLTKQTDEIASDGLRKGSSVSGKYLHGKRNSAQEKTLLS